MRQHLATQLGNQLVKLPGYKAKGLDLLGACSICEQRTRTDRSERRNYAETTEPERNALGFHCNWVQDNLDTKERRKRTSSPGRRNRLAYPVIDSEGRVERICHKCLVRQCGKLNGETDGKAMLQFHKAPAVGGRVSRDSGELQDRISSGHPNPVHTGASSEPAEWSRAGVPTRCTAPEATTRTPLPSTLPPAPSDPARTAVAVSARGRGEGRGGGWPSDP